MPPELVERVRAALDGAGHGHVRIVVSGGFDAERIERFEALAVPVDSYGVTADGDARGPRAGPQARASTAGRLAEMLRVSESFTSSASTGTGEDRRMR